MIRSTKVKTISYFSYKGGAGRSTLAFNTIPYIAKKLNASPAHPLIIMDLDVDSAGMTFLLENEGAPQARITLKGLLQADLNKNLASIPIGDHPLFSKLAPVGRCFGLDTENRASILFVPAKPGENLNTNGSTNYDIGGYAHQHLKDFVEFSGVMGCCGVIFDTPAGDQSTAKIALDISDTVATCMRITTQFRLGTIDYLKRKLLGFKNKKFIIIPNAVPTDEIKINSGYVEYDYIKENLGKKLEALDGCGNVINLEMLGRGQDFFGVNEVKRFKIEEGMLFKLDEDKLSDEEKKAKAAYKKVADLLIGEI